MFIMIMIKPPQQPPLWNFEAKVELYFNITCLHSLIIYVNFHEGGFRKEPETYYPLEFKYERRTDYRLRERKKAWIYTRRELLPSHNITTKLADTFGGPDGQTRTPAIRRQFENIKWHLGLVAY